VGVVLINRGAFSAGGQMQKCKQCGALFKPARLKQRFCGAACRIKFHNKEKRSGLMLTEKLRERIRDLAAHHEVSENEMACRILHQALNPDGMPIEDSEIYGKDVK
jgi:methionyl-tRNA synthetase